MGIFFTSDTHFNHKNIIKYEPVSRPFVTVEQMNQEIINRWNSVVSNDDIVVHLGDFFMGALDAEEMARIMRQLKCKNIILVKGNHDSKRRIQLMSEVCDRFLVARASPTVSDFYICGQRVILEHCPDPEYVPQDCVAFYGHVHSVAPTGWSDEFGFRGYHVGVDTNNLTPVSLEQIGREYIDKYAAD